MADTGAPWNLPYPLSTDLVRDGAQAIEDLAEATATGLTDAGSKGIGPNAVQSVLTGVFSTSSSSFVDITGLEVTITPSSATAKILLIAQTNMSGGEGTNRNALLQFAGGNAGDYIGDASGTSLRAAAMGGSRTTASGGWGSTEHAFNVNLIYLDFPNTTSPVTYSLQMRSSNGVYYINRSDADLGRSGRLASSITAIEVAP